MGRSFILAFKKHNISRSVCRVSMDKNKLRRFLTVVDGSRRRAGPASRAARFRAVLVSMVSPFESVLSTENVLAGR